MMMLAASGGAAGGPHPYVAWALANGAVAMWRMDAASGNEVDIIGGRNGVHGGTTTRGATGPLTGGLAVEFSTSGRVVVPDDNLWTPSDISVEYWIKLTTTPSSQQAHISKYDGSQRSWAVQTSSNHRGFAGIVSRTTSPFAGYYGQTADVLTVGTWYHFVIVFGASAAMKMYLNAVSQAISTLSGSNTPSLAPANNLTSLYLGNSPNQLATDTPGTTIGLRGQLSEVAIYNRILSAGEVAAHYALR